MPEAVDCPGWADDGNTMAMVARVTRCLKRARRPAEEVAAFQREALSGDYDRAVQTIMAATGGSEPYTEDVAREFQENDDWDDEHEVEADASV